MRTRIAQTSVRLHAGVVGLNPVGRLLSGDKSNYYCQGQRTRLSARFEHLRVSLHAHWLGAYSTRVPLFRSVKWKHLCPIMSGTDYFCVLK